MWIFVSKDLMAITYYILAPENQIDWSLFALDLISDINSPYIFVTFFLCDARPNGDVYFRIAL